MVYHCIFGSFMPLYQISLGAGAVTGFFSQLIYAIGNNIWRLILILIPLPLSIFLTVKKLINLKRINLIQIPAAAAICVVLSLLCSFSLQWKNKEGISVYDILNNPVTSTETSFKNAGLYATTLQELKALIHPMEYESEFLDTSLDNLDNRGKEVNVSDKVNFNKLDDNLSRYLSSVSPTPKNEYSAIAEGYNLITVCAEAFSPLLIDEEMTPTLYKLSTSGFVFKNFYNSFPNTTTNGEYSLCMGLMPDLGKNKVNSSFNSSANNYLPLCLGNIYTDMGYKAYGYHNYYGTFYDRHITHKNMGYDFKAILSGLEMEVGNPSSDLDMIKVSMPDFLNSTEPFHAYYMTYSGHYQYNWENDMSAKNRNKVEHLPYSDQLKAYIACQLELEYALTALLEGLEKAGQADNTVIALTGDHYPYGLGVPQYNELAGYEVDTNFERYRNSFICYVPGIEPVEIESYCSTIDILPTLLNIMGIEYDSRLLAGRDILSDVPHMAILSDRSFITNDFRYNSATGEVISDTRVDQTTLTDYRNYIDNVFTLSGMILQTDYYATVYDHTSSEDKPVIVNYDDIDEESIYIESTVTFMVGEGFMDPISETVFGVNEPGTTKEFIDTLYRMKKPEGYDSATEWAIVKSIVTEDTDMEKTATYADMAMLIYNYCGSEPQDISELAVKYPDIPSHTLQALKYCADMRIIAGDKYHSSYEMKDTATTRYHVAAFLQRMYLRDLI